MWRQSANRSFSLQWTYKTAPWEFQTKLLYYFFTTNNKSNLHFTRESSCAVSGFRDISLRIGFYSNVFEGHLIRIKRHYNSVLFRRLFDLKVRPIEFISYLHKSGDSVSRFRFFVNFLISSVSFNGAFLPKDGIIALWLATNRWYVVKFVSQKRNQSNNKNQWYNILVTFIFKLNCHQYETKIWLLSNLSNCRFTTRQF